MPPARHHRRLAAVGAALHPSPSLSPCGGTTTAAAAAGPPLIVDVRAARPAA
eukprot:COSAG04_NODE_28650_length_274_cov_0.794286_1_plen_51_part_10